MWRADSLEKTLMLGGIGGRRRRGRLRMKWLDDITDLLDVSSSELWELVMDRESWRAAIHWVAKSWTWLRDWTELNWTFFPCLVLLLPDLHTDFLRGKSGGLVFPSLSEFFTVYCDPHSQRLWHSQYSRSRCFSGTRLLFQWFNRCWHLISGLSAFSKSSLNLVNPIELTGASQVALVLKNPPVNAGDSVDLGSIPESGSFPGEENSNTLQCSCL